MKRLYVFAILNVVFSLAPAAYACSCVGSLHCGGYHVARSGDTTFLGKVLSVRTVERTGVIPRFPVRRRIYSIEVAEPLIGALNVSTVVEVETGMGGGDCGYTFDIGGQYLVDAGHYGENGMLSTGICNATMPENEAQPLLREIRATLAHQRLPDLSGAVLKRDSYYSDRGEPLANIRVHVTPPNGNAYTAVTDSEGIYTFPELPAAKYTIAYELPPNLVTSEQAGARTQTIDIEKSGSAGCRTQAIALPSATISGEIVDAAGQRTKMLGVVSLRKPGETKDESTTAFGGEDGRFTIQYVKAGTYRVVYRVFGHGPVREVWLDADANHPDATVTIHDGEQVAGITLIAK